MGRGGLHGSSHHSGGRWNGGAEIMRSFRAAVTPPPCRRMGPALTPSDSCTGETAGGAGPGILVIGGIFFPVCDLGESTADVADSGVSRIFFPV